jgi:hypothetical protein
MRRALTALVLLAALLVSGCGGDDEATIPRADADRLVDLLRQARVQAGDQDRCDKLADLVSQIRSEVDGLPNSVGRDTRRSLDDGVARLEDSSREECEDAEKPETETTPTTETETAPPPTETETAPPPTETEPPPPPPTETEPPPPPEEIPEEPGTGGTPGGGNGNGNGNQPFVPGGREKKRKGKDK